ncbi:MAG: hypothetical protein ACRCWI_00700 [Brevinema sp.]
MKKLFFFAVFLNFTKILFATETTFISDNGFNQVWLWQLSNITVTQEKGISLSQQSTKFYQTPQLLWTGKYINNSIYLGTAETASVLRVDPNNQETTIFTSSNHSLITSIVADKEGVLISASPESTLYHLDKNHAVISNSSLSNTYIWDIIPNPQGGYSVLTGLKAEVYEYNNYTLGAPITIETEDHLLKGLYIGNTLWVLGEKGLYKKDKDRFVAIASFQGNASGFVYTNDTFYVIHTVTIEANSSNNQQEQVLSKLSSISVQTGLVEELYSLQRFYFTSINIFDKQIILGADQFGLYAFYDLVTQKSYYSSLGEGKILDIFPKNQELVILTSDTSVLWSIERSLSKEGSFISEVYDANYTAQWGNFNAQISTPPNTEIQFFVQGGVTENPKYWTDWVRITNMQKPPLPPTRYIRYKAILSSDQKAIPYVHGITFPYTQLNIKPSIDSTKIEQKNDHIAFSWTGSDANKDTLEYNIFLAEDGLPKIKLNQYPLQETNFIFAKDTYPSGYKKISLIANDRPSNSDQTALTTEYTSLPIMFDGEVPIISDFKITKQRQTALIEVIVKDQHSVIKDVGYTLNGTRTVRLIPIDGIFDALSESFSFEVPLEEAIFIQIYAEDAALNKSFKGMTILPSQQ